MDAPEYLSQVLQEGQQRANLIASDTWQEIASKIGTIPSYNIEYDLKKIKTS